LIVYTFYTTSMNVLTFKFFLLYECYTYSISQKYSTWQLQKITCVTFVVFASCYSQKNHSIPVSNVTHTHTHTTALSQCDHSRLSFLVTAVHSIYAALPAVFQTSSTQVCDKSRLKYTHNVSVAQSWLLSPIHPALGQQYCAWSLTLPPSCSSNH